jgi:hypothetical protein
MKKLLPSSILLRTALLACVLPLSAWSQIVLQVSGDTTVSSDSPDTPLGSATSLGMTQIENADYQAYPMLKFDLSAFAGQTITSNGTLTLRFTGYYDASGAYPHSGDNLQLKALPSAFDPATTTYNNYAGFVISHTEGYTNQWVRDDINSFALIGTSQSYDFGAGGAQDMIFTIPQATLQGWADNPSANYGFTLFRAPVNYAPYYLDNSAMAFSSFEGGQGPTLSFSASAVPEPSTYAALAGAAMLGLAMWKRRKSARPAVAAV